MAMVEKKLSPFDVISIISDKKQEDWENIKKGYVPFVINRALSSVPDAVFFANEMNKHFALDTELQFAFYYHGLPKRKRYTKWNKANDDSEKINLIVSAYNVSKAKAKEMLPLLLAHIDTIKAETNRGGTK